MMVCFTFPIILKILQFSFSMKSFGYLGLVNTIVLLASMTSTAMITLVSSEPITNKVFSTSLFTSSGIIPPTQSIKKRGLVELAYFLLVPFTWPIA